MNQTETKKLKTGDLVEFSWSGKILKGTIEIIRKDHLVVKTPTGRFDVPPGRAEHPGTFEKRFQAFAKREHQ